ncbi:MAG: hypothetical protein ACI9U2_000838 [Bradymonadia bacterium]|jgi:hypothetical protein
MRTLLMMISLLGVAHAAPLRTSTTGLLDALGPLDARAYDPVPVIAAVNHLQPMGKAKGVAAIRTWLKARRAAKMQPPTAIFAVLRVLLRAPSGVSLATRLRPPALGGPVPAPTEMQTAHLPNFPILILDDVPMSVVEGYVLGGLPESAGMYLKYLEAGGQWRAAKLAPKSAGSVRYTLIHFGLYVGTRAISRAIEGQLKRLEGPR